LVKIFLLYEMILNLLGLLSMCVDKRRAVKGQWRISEKALFLVAIFGGSLGSIAGMYLFHHKTKHRRFTVGMPVIFLLQVGIVGILFLK